MNPHRDIDEKGALAFHKEILTLDAHLDTPVLFQRKEYDFLRCGSFEKDRTCVVYRD